MLQRVVRGALGFAVVLAAALGIQSLVRHRLPDIAGMAVVAAVALAAYVAQAYWIERRAPSELAPAALGDAALGLVLGCGLFVTTILLLVLGRIYRFEGFSSWQPLAAGLAVAIVAAVFEELLFRGFLFRWIQSTAGTWIAVAASAVAFGTAHAFNPGATPISTVAIALEAGVLLSAAFAASGNLWLPIGLHVGWNFTEGTVFGLAVSGKSADGMFRGTVSGPALLTGGAFGVEASAVAVVVCLGLAIGLLGLARQRNRIVAPMWLQPRR
jgi:uncharacterized protein